MVHKVPWCTTCQTKISETAPYVTLFGMQFCDRGCRDHYIDDQTQDKNVPGGRL